MQVVIKDLYRVGQVYKEALRDHLTVSQYVFGGADNTSEGMFCKQCDKLTSQVLKRLVGCSLKVTSGDYKTISNNVTGAMKCFKILEQCIPDQITLEDEKEIYYYIFLLKEIGGLYY